MTMTVIDMLFNSFIKPRPQKNLANRLSFGKVIISWHLNEDKDEGDILLSHNEFEIIMQLHGQTAHTLCPSTQVLGFEFYSPLFWWHKHNI